MHAFESSFMHKLHTPIRSFPGRKLSTDLWDARTNVVSKYFLFCLNFIISVLISISGCLIVHSKLPRQKLFAAVTSWSFSQCGHDTKVPLSSGKIAYIARWIQLNLWAFAIAWNTSPFSFTYLLANNLSRVTEYCCAVVQTFTEVRVKYAPICNLNT